MAIEHSHDPLNPSEMKKRIELSRRSLWLDRAFPRAHISTTDYVICLVTLSICFLLFLHPDIIYLGQNSLNYLYGSPLEFYENAAKHQQFGATYPPPLYIIFSIWLYPWKLAGAIVSPIEFTWYLAYWLKALTTIVYVCSVYVFYLISKEYLPNSKEAKYTAVAWATAPLAIFSQFIFSQTDIFYVLWSLLGYLMFSRRRTVLASAFFGVAVTFKFFPAFAFIPLLLLNEKRAPRILINFLVFSLPMLVIYYFYRDSQAFIHDPMRQALTDRIYQSSIETGGKIYLLPAAFMILCGVSYFRQTTMESRLGEMSRIWLIASVLPYILIFWHPQWLIFPVSAIVLTSAISDKPKSMMILDLLGIALFVAAVSLIFPDDVDSAMFRGDLLNIGSSNSSMAEMFRWFGDKSSNVFLTGFTGYLILQVVLKCFLRGSARTDDMHEAVDYGDLRLRLYFGLLIFVVPALISVYRGQAP